MLLYSFPTCGLQIVCHERHSGVDGGTERAVSWRGLARIQRQLSRHLTFTTSPLLPAQGNLSLICAKLRKQVTEYTNGKSH